MTAVPCRIKLDLFEGPLDLLLHLIKRSELDITDIPIATITDQYLAMLAELPELNLDGAGEYLVMAATLTYLKSRMLLPLPPEAEDQDGEDPRAALVQQLLEYQRFREAAVALGQRPLLARDVFPSPGEAAPPADPDDPIPPVRDASLSDLLDALRAVLERIRPPDPHQIERPHRSVAECVHGILARFVLDETVDFSTLFERDAHRSDVIVTFLALLEMIRLRVVRTMQEERFGPIAVRLAVPSLAEAVERVRDVGVVEYAIGGSTTHGDASGDDGAEPRDEGEQRG